MIVIGASNRQDLIDPAVLRPGRLDLKVKVQCNTWAGIDRVQILVNGRPEPKLNFTRATHPQMFKDGVVKFDEKLHIPLQSDAHLIVVAIDEDGDECVVREVDLCGEAQTWTITASTDDGDLVPALLEWGVPPQHINYEAFGPATVRGLSDAAATELTELRKKIGRVLKELTK